MLDEFVELLYSGLGKYSYLVQAHSHNTSLETPLSDPMFHNESIVFVVFLTTQNARATWPIGMMLGMV